MKVTCQQDELNRILSITSRAVATRSTIPALSNIKMTVEPARIICEANNLEIAIQASLPAVAQVVEKVLVPGKTLADLVKKLPSGPVDIIREERQVVIKSGKSKYQLPLLDDEKTFPEFPECNEGLFDLSSDVIKDAIRKVAFATIEDDARPFVSSVLLNPSGKCLDVVATDINRMALYKYPISSALEKNILIPARTIRELTAVPGETIRLTTDHKWLMAEADGFKCAIRLADATFPNYKSIDVKDPLGKLSVNRSDLYRALDRISMISIRAVFTISESGLTITAKESDQGECIEEIDADVSGAELTIMWNVRMVMDFLKAIDDDVVRITYTGENKPAKMTGKDETEYQYLLMPIQMKQVE